MDVFIVLHAGTSQSVRANVNQSGHCTTVNTTCGHRGRSWTHFKR